MATSAPVFRRSCLPSPPQEGTTSRWEAKHLLQLLEQRQEAELRATITRLRERLAHQPASDPLEQERQELLSEVVEDLVDGDSDAREVCLALLRHLSQDRGAGMAYRA